MLGRGAAKECGLLEPALPEPFNTGSITPDHVMAHRPPDVGESAMGISAEFPIEDAVANVYAGIADINSRAGNKLAHLGMVMAPAAERARDEV